MKFGRYEALRELGRGSMGVVFEAYDPQIDRTLALKVLRQDCCASKESVKRFLKEARTIGRLTHPNIVTVYDAGEDHGTIYIAMELLEGQPLNQVIRNKRLDHQEVLRLGIQIAETLAYAHSKGVVHRDIKPSNIVALPNTHIKITDFGIAHIEDPSASRHSFDGELVGTPAYMSPEQIQCKPVDGRSDIFSLGVILYQLSTGCKPFGGEGKTLATLFHEITHSSPREPAALNSHLDSRLSELIMQCLHKDPAERFETGHTLAEALRQCQKSEPARPIAPRIHSTEPRARALRIPLFILLLVSALAAFAFPFCAEIVENIEGILPASATRATTLMVHTSPFGAAISIDGTPAGFAPLEIALPAGEHHVTARLEGFASWSDDLTLGAAKNHPLVIQLQPLPKAASSKVNITPSAAGPRLENLPEDSRFQDFRDSVLRAAPSVPSKQAAFRLESTPNGAEILVDGRTAGTTPVELLVNPGDHLIVLKYADHETWERRVNVEEGRQYPFTIELKPIPKNPILALESDPPKAIVLVDGVERGKSPLKLKLSPGKHHVRFKLKRHKDWEAQVELAQAEEYPLKARLTPVSSQRGAAAPAVPTASSEPPPRSSNLTAARVMNELAPQNVWRRIRRLF
jgi:eukaryotic-like serine/threonine-protein kinase